MGMRRHAWLGTGEGGGGEMYGGGRGSFGMLTLTLLAPHWWICALAGNSSDRPICEQRICSPGGTLPHVRVCVWAFTCVYTHKFALACVCIDWTVSDHHPLGRHTHHVLTNTTVPSEVKDGLILSPGLYVERRTRITASLLCVYVCVCTSVCNLPSSYLIISRKDAH